MDAWLEDGDFYWSPLMTDDAWLQRGYYKGMGTATRMHIAYTKYGRFDLVNDSFDR